MLVPRNLAQSIYGSWPVGFSDPSQINSVKKIERTHQTGREMKYVVFRFWFDICINKYLQPLNFIHSQKIGVEIWWIFGPIRPNKVVRLPWFNNSMISSISLFWKRTSDFTILEFRSYRIKQNVVNEWMKQHWLLRSRSVTGHFAFLLLNYCFACCLKQLLFIAYIKNVSEIDYLHIFFVVVGMHKCLLWNMA